MQKETLSFTLSPSPLGLLLLAESNQGICALLIGENKETLIEELEIRFPFVILTESFHISDALSQILLWLTKPSPSLSFPLDERGSPFQKKVWEELRKIPFGKTTCYSGIAKTLHMPKGSRAVANACAMNPVAILTPCHRVLRKDGSLSGYRWGVEKKKWLLEKELQHPN